ncbi:unnamed protein product [Clonostachys rosea f. rosea IK726]|jgi:U4/U6.U5 tri-snRNP-associated protein 1|uniref:SART-1 protein n=2 Tax=Bionectria ochroleuca TaxID=29856 RepID=A0A0B7JR30_BIOOC|nr:unnamed protein product [Clonostachys rosea f. rosea IK726]
MDAATIEETNRIRVSLGLKPLPVPGADAPASTETKDGDDDAPSTVESRQAQSYDNYNKVMEAEAAKKKREERNAAVKKARENAQRLAKLEGRGLGEEDDKGDQDAKSWLLGQKKRQKKIDKARKIEEELAAAEAEAAAAVQYTSKDLAGIKIAHDTSTLLDGGDQILTLKDTTIEENEEEGDQLENIDLRDQEKLSERLDLKKKRPGYNPNDDEDGDTGILAQYDEEIMGKQGKSFTLGENGMIGDIADILDQPAPTTLGKQSVSLDDIVGDGPISSDYLAPSEIKVKKPKKKKNKSRQKHIDNEDDVLFKEPVVAENDSMDIDGSAPTTGKKRKQEIDIIDDDEDLQASLAAQRKLALKKRKKTRFEDLAKQLKEQEDDSLQDDAQNGTGMVIGAISEFVSGLTKHEDDEEAEERRQKRRKQATKTPEATEDQEMEDAHDKSVQFDIPEPEPVEEQEDGTGIGEEKHISDGMGAALSLLRERGLIEEARGEDQIKLERQRQEFLHGKAALERNFEEQALRQREYDRHHAKMDKMSTREREDYARHQNQRRDHQQAKKMVDLFQSTYKPTFQLKYTDEHGRELNQKEAFKQLSHEFHGKGSGKEKTEKRLKKIADEKRREAQSMFDATQHAGMSMATSQQLKKRKEAGVRLG